MTLFSAPSTAQTRHFFVIDLMRGLASVSILLWHYQHFYYQSAGVYALSAAEKVSQPFYRYFHILYDYGHYAVQFFWMISGFIFCAIYVGKHVTTRDFVLNRFARLYPLHFLTLIIILFLQNISLALTGNYQIYNNNDLYHFMLNVFFASWWGLQKGYSFNGPIWSVSVEILVYVGFWLSRPYLYRIGIVGPALLAIVAWVFAYRFGGHFPLLRQCVFFFLLGEVIFLFFRSVQTRPIVLASIGMALLASSAASARWLPASFDSATIILLLSAIMLFCCSAEATRFTGFARRVRWLGDATYGMYLWHIPVQIIVLMCFDRIVGLREVVIQPWFFVAYLASVIGLAHLSFVIVEGPMRRWIRRMTEPYAIPAKARGATQTLDSIP